MQNEQTKLLREQLIIKLAYCHESVTWLRARQQKPIDVNLKTDIEYKKIAELMFQRAAQLGSLSKAISNTKSIRTFQKRISAVRHYVFSYVRMAKNVLVDSQVIDNQEYLLRLQKMVKEVDGLYLFLPEFCRVIGEGFRGERARRNSKRRALSGLPEDWREQLCERAAGGKYAISIMVEATTGCRPGELFEGVRLWVDFHPELKAECLMFHVLSVKVREGHSLPNRYVAFRVDREEEIVRSLIKLVSSSPNKQLVVSVTNPGNFSKEMARLARSLWPSHKHSVTSMCLRHQTSASTKKTKGGEAASIQLGHISPKTRKYYGTARQGRSGLVADWVGAELPPEMVKTSEPHKLDAFSENDGPQ